MSLNQINASRSYKQGELELNHFPRIVFVELTQRCNLKCSMCHHYSDDYSGHIMSWSTFSLIVESFFAEAEIVDLRGWGESLILPDFHKFVELVVEHNAIPRIVSNLSFENDQGLISLSQANSYISISLDACDQHLLKKIRGGAEKELILANICKLRSWYQQFGADFERVSLGVTVQRDNIGQLSSIVSLASENGIERINLFPRQNDGDFSPPLSYKESCMLIEELGKAMNLAKDKGISLRIGARLFPGMELAVSEYSFHCIKPWQYCFITWNGHLGCCDYLIGPGSEERAFGNIHEEDTLYLWQKSINASEFRRSHIEDTRLEACSWCYKNRLVDFEDYFETNYKKRVMDSMNCQVSNCRLSCSLD